MLPHPAHAAHQLYAATSENYTFQWTPALQQAFDSTQDMLKKDILNTNLDGDLCTEVYIDASKFAVCIVVTQGQKIIACASKVLNPSQRRWATIERELYAAAWGLKNMRFYLHGIFFNLFTDHKPLVGFFNKNEEAPNNRMMTMLLSTMEYSFSIEYIPGVRNILADFGTRNIDTSEWDKPHVDDLEGLHELFSFESKVPIPILNFLKAFSLHPEDIYQLETAKIQYSYLNHLVTVQVRNQQMFYVPIQCRRPLFWYMHKELHHGSAKLLQSLQDLGLFWPHRSASINNFLSQCICATKKNKAPHHYSEIKHITASYTLHILAIDLYFYAEKIYFTAFCIYSRLCGVKEVKNKQAQTVLQAFSEFCDTYATPTLLSCDNGGEFQLIETQRIPHPSEHPQSNGIIERFHEELGKLSRIFSTLPDKVYDKLNSTKSKLLPYLHFKELHHDSSNCILYYETRTFSYNDLVWRKVPSRKRAKNEDTFTGPHRVLKRTGEFTYNITSHLLSSRTLLVNLNDIKILHFPDTRNWKLNSKYIPDLLMQLNSSETTCCPLIDFHSIGALVGDLMENKPLAIKFFIIPDWPCADWYKPLHDYILAEAVRLPTEEDIFLSASEDYPYPLGKFAWSHWLFELRT